jgi:TatD DNase family protein
VLSWFDSHAHLQSRYLAEDPEPAGVAQEQVPDPLAALEQAARGGVDRLVCIGTDALSSAEALDLAARARAAAPGSVPSVWSTVGLHPHDAKVGAGPVIELATNARHSADPGLVAIGECGLDYHYLHSHIEEQRAVFAEQIHLARDLGLALVIHARNAWDDLFEIMQREPMPDRVILHCFTGGPT